MITFNYAAILQILFAILLGMIFGLTLLSFNFQSLFEVVIVKLCLFWESESMKALIRKNLIAHKQRNKYTAIIFSLTLGSMIFLVVSANLQAD
jgi:hypothetical protein